MLRLSKQMAREVKSAQQAPGPYVFYLAGKFYVGYKSRAGMFPCTETRLQPIAKKHGLILSATKRPAVAVLRRNKNNTKFIHTDRHVVNGDLQEAAEILFELGKLSGKTKKSYLKRIGL